MLAPLARPPHGEDPRPDRGCAGLPVLRHRQPIDSLDPAFAPGTGTVEIGGLTVYQALEVVRGAAGLNLVGGDLVEVSPPYDPSGNTALIGANLLYEMLCVLPGVPQGRQPRQGDDQ